MTSNSIIRLVLDHLGCMTNFYIHCKVLSILLLRIQSDAGKYGPEKTPYLDTYHAFFYML